MRSTRLARTTVASVVLVATTACSAAVTVPPPDPPPTGAAAYACAALHGRLPDEVSGATTTAIRPQSPLTSAWGDPAIVLRCGVPVPVALQPTSQLLTVDGVDWLPEQLSHGYLFTTVGRVLNVEVSVPDQYSPEAGALADLSPTVATMDPPTKATTAPQPSPSAS